MHSLERLLKIKLPFTRDSDEATPSSGEGSNDEISSSGAIRLHSHKRLTPDDIASVVASYQDGQTTIRLAEQFGVDRRTISKVLTDASVSLRGRPLSEQQIDEAVVLYKSGLSLAKVGKVVGAQARTIQLRLRERGVTTRDTHGRSRRAEAGTSI